jgi:uncharacterized membrane protein
MEWLEHLEIGLEQLVAIAKFTLEALSVACVVAGLLKTIQLAFWLNLRRRETPFPFNRVRLRFGVWLALALEFQLGADIVASTVAPNLESLAKLALLAVIRTFLNYFLSKELEAQLALEKEQAVLHRELQQ